MNEDTSPRGLGRREALLLGGAFAGATLASQIAGIRPAHAAAGSTLVIAAAATPQSLDNEYDASLGTIDAIGQLYDSLIQFKKKPDPKVPSVLREDFADHPELPGGLAVEGKLAESWEVDPKGMFLRFHLKKGIISNWGNELDADDVKYTWARKFALNAIGGFIVGLMGLPNPDAIVVEDKYTVTFRPSVPNPLMLKLQLNLYNNIFDSKKLKQVATKDDPWSRKFLENNSAGYGPYELASITRGQQAVFKARANYWGGKPAIDTIIYKEVPTSATRVSLLQGGAVDIALGLQPLEIVRLKKVPGVTVETVPASSMMWIELNTKFPPFDKVEVRQAMNYAFPRDQVMKSIFQDIASPLTGCMPDIYPDFNAKANPYSYDLDKAKALLKSVGLESGFKMEISYNAGDPSQEPIAILYQTSLRQIGVELTLHKIPAGTYYNEVSARKQPMIMFVDAPWGPDPGYSTRLYFYSKSFVDYSNYANAEVDKLIEDGSQMTDIPARNELFGKVQDIVMKEAPWVFVAFPNFTITRKADLQGMTYYSTNAFRFADFSRKA